jgi:hypothetical protein
MYHQIKIMDPSLPTVYVSKLSMYDYINLNNECL